MVLEGHDLVDDAADLGLVEQALLVSQDVRAEFDDDAPDAGHQGLSRFAAHSVSSLSSPFPLPLWERVG